MYSNKDKWNSSYPNWNPEGLDLAFLDDLNVVMSNCDRRLIGLIDLNIHLPFVPFKSQSSILPPEAVGCVPRGALSGKANEGNTMGVRFTLFPLEAVRCVPRGTLIGRHHSKI